MQSRNEERPKLVSVGIMSREEWVQCRQDELASAIKSHANNDLTIPTEWVQEYNELVKRVK